MTWGGASAAPARSTPRSCTVFHKSSVCCAAATCPTANSVSTIPIAPRSTQQRARIDRMATAIAYLPVVVSAAPQSVGASRSLFDPDLCGDGCRTCSVALTQQMVIRESYTTDTPGG